MGRIMFKVRPFEAKTRLFKFDHEWMNTFELVQCSKNYVRVCLMSNLVNLVIVILGLMFDVGSFEAKNRVFKFDYQ